MASVKHDEGMRKLHQGKYREAMAPFKKAQMHNGEPNILMETAPGLSYRGPKKYDAAIQHYSNAISMKKRASSPVDHSTMYALNGQCNLAMEDAKEALSMKPTTGSGCHSDALANMTMANCLTMEAIAEMNRGMEKYNEGNYKEAITRFKKAQESSSKPSWTIEDRMGLSHDALDQYEAAMEHHTNSIRIKDTSTIRTHRAGAYAANNERQKAMEDAQAALSMQPTTQPAFHTDAEANLKMTPRLIQEEDYKSAFQHAEAGLATAEENEYPEEYMTVLEELRDTAKQNMNN